MITQIVRNLLRSAIGLTALSAAVAVTTTRTVDHSLATFSPGAIPLSAAIQPEAERKENPHVAPGLVRWHPSFSDAQKAAKQSGKPVLLFHMMGQLDRQFC